MSLQETGGVSGHNFSTADVFVPFHQRVNEPSLVSTPTQEVGMSAQESFDVRFDAEKRLAVHQRYCHVYTQAELASLVRSVPDVTVLDEYYDTGNWCILVQKSVSDG